MRRSQRTCQWHLLPAKCDSFFMHSFHCLPSLDTFSFQFTLRVSLFGSIFSFFLDDAVTFPCNKYITSIQYFVLISFSVDSICASWTTSSAAVQCDRGFDMGRSYQYYRRVASFSNYVFETPLWGCVYATPVEVHARAFPVPMYLSVSVCRPWALIRNEPKIVESTPLKKAGVWTLIRAQRENLLVDALKIDRVTKCFSINYGDAYFHPSPKSLGRRFKRKRRLLHLLPAEIWSTLKSRDGND